MAKDRTRHARRFFKNPLHSAPYGIYPVHDSINFWIQSEKAQELIAEMDLKSIKSRVAEYMGISVKELEDLYTSTIER